MILHIRSLAARRGVVVHHINKFRPGCPSIRNPLLTLCGGPSLSGRCFVGGGVCLNPIAEAPDAAWNFLLGRMLNTITLVVVIDVRQRIREALVGIILSSSAQELPLNGSGCGILLHLLIHVYQGFPDVSGAVPEAV